MKQSYKKATAKVVLFDNSDVVTTSGVYNENSGDECTKKNHPGWAKGNGCESNDRSGKCTGQFWK